MSCLQYTCIENRELALNIDREPGRLGKMGQRGGPRILYVLERREEMEKGSSGIHGFSDSSQS